MIRNALLAGFVALGTAAAFGTAHASDVRLSGGGDNMTINYVGPAPHENVLGGAVASITGGGSDTVYTASRVVAAQPARNAALIGGGRDARIVLLDAASPGAPPRG